MKYISEDREQDTFSFETTKEELEVCSKVLHVALKRLGDEFDARHQDTHESPYETGLELDKNLATLVEEHKNAAPTDIITVNIRFFEAGIIYDAFNEVCNGLSYGFANIPTREQFFGYNKEELQEFYGRYKKVYMDQE